MGKFLTSFFLDDAGEPSCMRLVAFLTVAVVLGVWAFCNLRSGMYVPLGYAEAGLVGSAILGKAYQARQEYGYGIFDAYRQPFAGMSAGGLPDE